MNLKSSKGFIGTDLTVAMIIIIITIPTIFGILYNIAKSNNYAKRQAYAVKIATDVLFMEHDIISVLFNEQNYREGAFKYKDHVGTIEIGDNVFIGARSIILYNTKIGSNCIIGAGSIVTEDIPNNSVVAGTPAKVIGTYDNTRKKFQEYSKKYSKYDLFDDKVLEELFWKQW